MNQKKQLKRKKKKEQVKLCDHWVNNKGGNSIPMFDNNTKSLSHTRSHVKGVLYFKKRVCEVLVCYTPSMVIGR